MCRELIQLRLARMKKEYPGCKYMRKCYAHIDVYIVHYTHIRIGDALHCIALLYGVGLMKTLLRPNGGVIDSTNTTVLCIQSYGSMYAYRKNYSYRLFVRSVLILTQPQ